MKKDNVFWGVILVLAAVYVLTSSMGLMPDVNVVRLVAGVICVMVFCKSMYRLEFGGILFSAAIFVILFKGQFGIETLSSWSVLCAALLGSIGLDMIFGKSLKRKKEKNCFCGKSGETVVGSEVILDAGAFNGYKRSVSSDDFQKACIRAKFSGVEVSFDDAIIQSGFAVIDLDVAFSGVQIYIPKSWTLVNETQCVFGGFEEHTVPYSGESGPVITISGNVKFAGVEVYRI